MLPFVPLSMTKHSLKQQLMQIPFIKSKPLPALLTAEISTAVCEQCDITSERGCVSVCGVAQRGINISVQIKAALCLLWPSGNHLLLFTKEKQKKKLPPLLIF